MKDEFLKWAQNNEWIIEQSSDFIKLPNEVALRYKKIPEQWLDFISTFNNITNKEEDAWFLTCYNYLDTCDDFLDMCLDSADGDEEWINEIKSFWNNNFPIFMSIGGDYHYFAINIDTGNVVEGYEPEFVDARVVANTFNDFLMKVISGDLLLI